MQPDLPEPVVPAIRRCGMRARSVQTALPAMSLPSQTESGLAEAGSSSKMSPSVTRFGRQVGDLDADRLLAGDRRQDADLGGGERVGEVVLEVGDLGDLGAGRQLQLVASHARAGDLADDVRLDAEVSEGLDQYLRDPLAGVGELRVAAASGAECSRRAARSRPCPA